jgi:hypothetical protein
MGFGTDQKSIEVEVSIFAFGFLKKIWYFTHSIECREFDWCRVFNRLACVNTHLCTHAFEIGTQSSYTLIPLQAACSNSCDPRKMSEDMVPCVSILNFVTWPSVLMGVGGGVIPFPIYVHCTDIKP